MAESRIYVVVPAVLTTAKGKIKMECGRLMAQCAHVVSRMRVEEFVKQKRKPKKGTSKNWESVTTIVLKARDSKELDHVLGLLTLNGICRYTFRDNNQQVYGPGRFLTAVCTVPIDPVLLTGILDYLPLWSCKD